MLRDCRGIESLPVVLLLGLVLGASALGLGVSCLQRAKTLADEQRALSDFEEFVLKARQISSGGVGSWQRVRFELPESAIVLEGRLAQLLWKGEVRAAELLPLPVASETPRIERGVYLFELRRGTDGYFLMVTLEERF